MRSAMHRWGVAVALSGVVMMAVSALAISDESDDAELSAGGFTLMRQDAEAYSEPAPMLDYKQGQRFLRGRHHFNQNWVQFPSIGGDWGLGPTFITDRCTGCHVKAGRGRPPEAR